MKNRFFWNLTGIIGWCVVCAINILCIILSLTGIFGSPLATLMSAVFLTLAVCIFTLIVIPNLQGTVKYQEESVLVKRPHLELYTVHIKKIKRIIVCKQHISELAGRNDSLAIRVDWEDGKLIGVGARMLTAILAIYPHIKVVVLYSGWRLGKKNAILLAQRGCLNERQLREVQKRYHLPDDLVKIN